MSFAVRYSHQRSLLLALPRFAVVGADGTPTDMEDQPPTSMCGDRPRGFDSPSSYTAGLSARRCVRVGWRSQGREDPAAPVRGSYVAALKVDHSGGGTRGLSCCFASHDTSVGSPLSMGDLTTAGASHRHILPSLAIFPASAMASLVQLTATSSRGADGSPLPPCRTVLTPRSPRS